MLDQIEVKLALDVSTMVANLMAGAMSLTLGGDRNKAGLVRQTSRPDGGA